MSDRSPKSSAPGQAVLAAATFMLRPGPGLRTRTGLVRKLLASLTRRWDPVVRWQLEGVDLLMPLSHDLPLARPLYPHAWENLTTVSRVTLQKYPDLAALDVGANVGDSLAVMRAAGSFPILAIEPHPRFAELLRANAAGMPEVEVEQAFAGDGGGSSVRGLLESFGTATLVRVDGAAPGPGPEVPQRSLEEVAGEHPRFRSPKLIKIDTDGYDCDVIRGAIDFIGRARPVLFFEYEPHLLAAHGDDGISVFRGLRDVGYTRALVYENTGEFLLSTDLSDTSLLEDLHRFYQSYRGARFCDICAFHDEDRDLATRLHETEAGAARARAEIPR
jgi:FkbM family methyltransferase